MKKKNSAFRLLFIALLVAQALVVFKLEEFIPVPFPFIPGAKLGLANIFTMVALFSLSPLEAFTVVVLRSLLAMFIGSNPAAFIYSFTGVLFAYAMMLGLKLIFKERLSHIGISVAGAFSHNLGQLTAAAFVLENVRMFMYLPVLTLLAIPTGFFVGMVANFLLDQLRRTGTLRDLYKEKNEK